MSETPSTPDAKPTEPQPAAAPSTPTMPKIDVAEIIKTAMSVAMKPAAFFETIREQKGYEKALVFAVAMGAVAGVIGAVVSILHRDGIFLMSAGFMGGLMKLILMPVVAAIGMFLGGGIIHLLVLILGGKPDYQASTRIAAYSMVIMPAMAALDWLPVVSVAASIYGLYIGALGMMALHQTAQQKTMIVVGIFALLSLYGSVHGYLAVREASKWGERMQNDASEFSKQLQKGGGDFGKALEQMGKGMQGGK